jgi:NDP-sugar pyrophosphorylase family protein/aminoglycoside/choline kinase family phosphotransferase
MSRLPKKAIVLAAGFGTRMLPLTRDVPKPLMPLWGVPMIDHALGLLAGWGVTDVLVNLHHKAHDVLAHVMGRPRSCPRICLSFEPDILGTGGALRKAEWFPDEDPFWLLNADVAADLDPRPLCRAFQAGKTLAALWLHPLKGPLTVEMQGGFIESFRSARPRSAGTYTFCGLHLVSPAILDREDGYLPAAGPASIVTAYERAMEDGWKIAGVCVEDSYWADVGTPAQYLEAHGDLLKRLRDGARGGRLAGQDAVRRMKSLRKVEGFAAVSEAAAVSPSARIRDSVVWSGASIGARARLDGVIVGRGVRIEGAGRYVAMKAVDALDEAEQVAVRSLGWPLERVLAMPLGPRGSARTFTRLESDGRRVMLVRYDPGRLENALYAGHARFLAKVGLRVPAVLMHDPAACLTVFEDLGDESLLAIAKRAEKNQIERLYRRVLEDVARLHVGGTRMARARGLRVVPSFRPVLYRWEHEYFIEHMLRGRCGLPAAAAEPMRKDLWTVARRLMKAPRVLLHRDLQSSNILIAEGRPGYIDFQGMRYGPAVYDLASLLCDPYVSLPEDLQERLVDFYAVRNPSADAGRLFWLGAVQRLAQAMGAFARLGALADTRSFGRHIPPAVRMLRRALARVEGLPALKCWADGAFGDQ